MDALRLAGPPGVGKSTAAWAIAQHLASGGERVAYVDIDQLGMCYPAPEDAPDRWELKENALRGVARRFRRDGVQRLVVSGVASPDLPPPQLHGCRGHALWLDAAAGVLRDRLAPRPWDATRVESVVEVGSAESARLDGDWERLTTDRLTVDGTVDAVLARWANSRTGSHDHAEVPGEPLAMATAPVLWITGPRSVGASSVGWQIARSSWGRGQRVGFADAAELSFVWNTSTSSPADNTVALHQTLTAAGAESLVAVGPLALGPAVVRRAFEGTEVRFVRLDATDEELLERALDRIHIGGPRLAADDLAGATEAFAEWVARRAVSDRLLPIRAGELVVDTAGTTAAEAADRLLQTLRG